MFTNLVRKFIWDTSKKREKNYCRINLYVKDLIEMRKWMLFEVCDEDCIELYKKIWRRLEKSS